MDVHIDELHSTVDAVDGEALLTPRVQAQIVRAVLRELENRQRGRDTLRSELDLRPIVDQQRDTGA